MPWQQSKKTGAWREIDENGNPTGRTAPATPTQAPQQGAIPIGPRKTEATPSGYRRGPDGTLEPIPGGPAIKTSYRQLTPSEAASRGLPPLQEGQFYQVSSEGSISVVGAPQRDRAYRPMPDGAAKRYEDAVSGYANLDRAISTFNPDYAGNTITGGLENSIQRRFDSFGTKGQAQWWADVNATDNALRNALFGASLTAGEQAAWDRTSIDPSMDPAQVKRNLEQRREIARGALSRKTAFLKANGYDPDAVNALAGEYAPNLGGVTGQSGSGTVWDQARIMAPVEAAAPFGATERQVPIPAEMQAEYQQYMANNFGNINPDDYANFRAGLDAKYGFGPQSPDLYKADAAKFNEYYNAGGRQVAPLPGPTEKLSLSQYISNSLENNPITASLANAGDAVSLGTISLIDRKFGDGNMQRLTEANPKAALMGQVAGSIVGGGALNRLGSAAAGRFLPALLQGGKGAAAARGIAGDVAYSTIYGTNTGGSPIESALMGGIGGALGRGVGGVAGKAVNRLTAASSLNVTPALERLRAAGVTPTIGQIMRGKENPGMIARAIAGMEDVTANNGVTGNLINPARARAMEQANNSAFNIHAGETGPVSGYGVDALNQLDSMKNAAYSRATEGVSIPLDDPQLIQQLGDARKFGLAQDAARSRRDFEISTREGLAPIFGNGDSMSGSQLQDALRFTQGEQRVWGKAANGPMPDPSARGVADAFGRVEDSLISAAARNAPGAIPKLKQANRINRTLSVLDSAVPTDGEGIFTGAQLMNAIKANNSKFGAGRGVRAAQKSPLFQLASDMQAVLPNKIPPTGVNAAPMLALMGLGSTGAGYATDNSTLGTIGAALLAATPYTKRGGSAVAKALLDRPDSLKALGTAINKRKGLFGSAAIPLMLEANNKSVELPSLSSFLKRSPSR